MMWDQLADRIFQRIVKEHYAAPKSIIQEEIQKFVQENIVMVYFKVDVETAKKAKGSD